MIYAQLFWEFLKTGLFSIGGGLATLPFLKSMAERYPWFSPADLLNMVAVSESTPGSIGVNMSTYTGFHSAGLLGAVLATFALILPSFFIIIMISKMLQRFRDSHLVESIFYGLRPASAGLILGAISEVLLMTLLHIDLWNGFSSILQVLNLPALLLFAVFVVLIAHFPKVHPIVFIAIGAVCGICYPF